MLKPTALAITVALLVGCASDGRNLPGEHVTVTYTGIPEASVDVGSGYTPVTFHNETNTTLDFYTVRDEGLYKGIKSQALTGKQVYTLAVANRERGDVIDTTLGPDFFKKGGYFTYQIPSAWGDGATMVLAVTRDGHYLPLLLE
jgi:hypothetical protein